MSASKIKSWINSLGQTHEYLMSESLVSDDEFLELFPGDDELYLEPQVGISMSFRAGFQGLCITLRKSTPSTVEYTGELPRPYSLRMNQSDVHALLGKPMDSSGPVRMPQPMGQTGGWESYQSHSEINPNIRICFEYLESMEVSAIVFIPMNKDHD
ncbi:DUF6392 family protein [Pseudomonas sp. Irchel 3A5]|uniref:DUF6392 family protein n=1 Tax=Pseudomonas sp. Irchel 3A5 TaxID=2008911 RepID=UPI000BA45CFA|nr:DUF6392 family protein [Pseudomonas sp. Irchel 3A5]